MCDHHGWCLMCLFIDCKALTFQFGKYSQKQKNFSQHILNSSLMAIMTNIVLTQRVVEKLRRPPAARTSTPFSSRQIVRLLLSSESALGSSALTQCST